MGQPGDPSLVGGSTSCSAVLWERLLYLAVMSALCVVHLLLPIERGFPVLRIAGYPVSWTIVVGVGTAMALLVHSRGRYLKLCFNRYTVSQLAVVWSFTLSALVSADVEASVYVVLAYFVTFVVNFLTLGYLFGRGRQSDFAAVISIVASVAATLGIIEGLLRYRLPFYTNIYLNYDPERMRYAFIRPDFRALGTLGNPIVFGVALALAIPFAMELTNRAMRCIVVGLLLVASFFTISLTSLALLAVFVAGYLRTLRGKWRPGLLVLLIIVAPVAAGLIASVGLGNNQQLTQWADKFSLQNPNLQVRLMSLRWAVDRFLRQTGLLHVLLGSGLKTTSQALSSTPGFRNNATLDNTFACLLLDAGLIGLMSYLVMMLTLIRRHRWAGNTTLHWYSLVGLLAAGMSFEVPYYATFNFVWAASVARLTVAQRRRDGDSIPVTGGAVNAARCSECECPGVPGIDTCTATGQ